MPSVPCFVTLPDCSEQSLTPTPPSAPVLGLVIIKTEYTIYHQRPARETADSAGGVQERCHFAQFSGWDAVPVSVVRLTLVGFQHLFTCKEANTLLF